jgi:nicotinamidase/pyrazinamidase
MAVTIDPSHDALVIVDVQNDFCPGGSLAVADGDAVAPVLSRYAQRFAAVGAPVFASRDWHPSITKHFKAYGGVWPPHCIQQTHGAEFHPALALPTSAQIVSKGMDPDADAYSCFQAETADGMDFATALRAGGVRRLFVGGLATDYCVKSTVLDARRYGFAAVVLEDAVRAVDITPGDGEKALAEMKAAGAGLLRFQDLGRTAEPPSARAARIEGSSRG